MTTIDSRAMGTSPWAADADFSAGTTTINQANTVNLSKVTNLAPTAVYQSARIATTTTRTAYLADWARTPRDRFKSGPRFD